MSFACVYGADDGASTDAGVGFADVDICVVGNASVSSPTEFVFLV